MEGSCWRCWRTGHLDPQVGDFPECGSGLAGGLHRWIVWTPCEHLISEFLSDFDYVRIDIKEQIEEAVQGLVVEARALFGGVSSCATGGDVWP